jgi:hypothetical protein
MADILSHSPEAAYATKGNIVYQKAHGVNRTVSAAADDAASAGVAPSAESTTADHFPTGVAVVDNSFTIVAAADSTGGNTGV